MSRTPHPSRYAIHLLPLEKAYCNRTLFVTIISVFAQQSVRFDDIYISKAWFKTSLLQWEKVAAKPTDEVSQTHRQIKI